MRNIDARHEATIGFERRICVFFELVHYLSRSQKMTGTATREEIGFADNAQSRQIHIAENAISTRSARIEEIDGIRGWAALAVVIFHALPETFSKIHPELINPIWWFFIDGKLAVCIFFILSGDALSTPFMVTRKKSVLDKMVLKRYFRLAAPIFITTLITIIAIRVGVTYNVSAARIVHNEGWLGAFLPSQFGNFEVFKFSFVTVFNFGNGGHNFNPFLWTMHIELVGSILVFMYLYVQNRLKYPMHALILIILFFMAADRFFAMFFIGSLLSHFRATGGFDRIRNRVETRVGAPLLVLIAYLIDVYFINYGPITTGSGLKQLTLSFVENNKQFIMASLFVVGAYLSIDACRFFRNTLSIFLGRVSFPIYLMQLVVFCTLSSFLIARFGRNLDDLKVCLAIAGLGVAVTIICGYVLSIVERYLMGMIDRALSTVVTDQS
jgi:peptidoglycan/LPS O-acetylase OafA/YrhL